MSENELAQENRIEILEAKASDLELICAYMIRLFLDGAIVKASVKEAILADILSLREAARTRDSILAADHNAFAKILDHLQRYNAVGNSSTGHD